MFDLVHTQSGSGSGVVAILFAAAAVVIVGGGGAIAIVVGGGANTAALHPRLKNSLVPNGLKENSLTTTPVTINIVKGVDNQSLEELAFVNY